MKIKETAIAIGQVVGIAVSIFFISFVVFAWVGPTSNPPEGNISFSMDSVEGDFEVGGSLIVDEDLRVSGQIYGWAVPTDVKITNSTHNGNFGGYKAMNDWIQDNDCAGYRVCDVYEVGRWEMAGGTMAKNNAWVNAYAWHHHSDAQRDCEGWNSSSASFRGMRFNGAGPGTAYLFGSSTCSTSRPVMCCKY